MSNMRGLGVNMYLVLCIHERLLPVGDIRVWVLVGEIVGLGPRMRKSPHAIECWPIAPRIVVNSQLSTESLNELASLPPEFCISS